jgi:hypothetical protein
MAKIASSNPNSAHPLNEGVKYFGLGARYRARVNRVDLAMSELLPIFPR